MPTHVKPAPTFGLRDIDIRLARGTVTGIVGESGSGKTTIGRIIAGLNSAQTGTVTIDGTEFDVSKSGRRSGLLGRVQMIFQDLSVSWNPRTSIDETLGESIRFGARIGPRGALPDLSTMMEAGFSPKPAQPPSASALRRTKAARLYRPGLAGKTSDHCRG